MLSYCFIAAPHFGHAEFGKTMDSSLGTRWITTFKKLPTAAPNTPTRIKPATSGKPLIDSKVETKKVMIFQVSSANLGTQIEMKDVKTAPEILNRLTSN